MPKMCQICGEEEGVPRAAHGMCAPCWLDYSTGEWRHERRMLYRTFAKRLGKADGVVWMYAREPWKSWREAANKASLATQGK